MATETQDVSTRPESAHRDLVVSIHDRLTRLGVSLPLRLWDGTELGPSGLPFRVVVNHPWSLRSMLLPPTDRAAGEAYVHDDIDVEGDLVAALHHLASADVDGIGWMDRLRLARRLLDLPRPPRRTRARAASLRGRAHSKARDRDAIQFHYDLGNDFFRLFLDRDLVYSCAYFAEDDADLDRAQRRKLDLVCRKLHLQPGDRLLDIGCGWGSLVLHAARTYGVEAVGVTLSEAQAELGQRRVAEAGLSDRVEIRLEDYRDVSGSYDAVASIGMFEHVGADQLPVYFQRAHELTTPGGRFLNHGITTGQRQEARELSDDRGSFVGHYVFPDGALVPSWEAVHQAEEVGFEVIDLQQLRPHYALTLRQWIANLEANHDRAVEIASEVDYRIWRAYMAGSVVGFETNDLGVVQVLASRDADLPLGRAWMQPTV